MKLVVFPSSSLMIPSLSLEAKIEVHASGFLLNFSISGNDVDQIFLAERSKNPARKTDLWKETCFECFFGVGNSKQYFEFNGSPSGDWALYSFDDYRQGMKDLQVFQQPVMEKMETTKNQIDCSWRIPFFTKTIIQNASISAVIKTKELSFWAIKHSGQKPDFHLRDSFTFRFI